MLTALPAFVHTSGNVVVGCNLQGDGSMLIDFWGGTASFDQNITAGGADFAHTRIEVHDDAQIIFNAPQTLRSLDLYDSAKVIDSQGNLADGHGNVLDLSGLSIGTNATLDLTDNGAILRYSPDVTSEQAAVANVRSLLVSGYAGGAWTGTGIVSSLASSDPNHNTAVGYADNQDLGDSSFDGVALSDSWTEVLLQYSYYGDADLSGRVDAADASLIAAGLAGSGTGWDFGDFNYSGGPTDSADQALFQSGYGLSVSNPLLPRAFSPAGFVLSPIESTPLSADIATFTDTLHGGLPASDYVAQVYFGTVSEMASVYADPGTPGQFRISAQTPALTDPNALMMVLIDYAPDATDANGNPITGRGAAIGEPILLLPATPTGLTAVAASASEIDLAWTNPSLIATGFVLDRSADPAFAAADTLTIPLGTTATTYADTGLSPATHYYYRIRSTYGSGQPVESADSDTADAWTAPLAPSGLLAAAVSDSQIDLAWSNDATDAIGTDIYISDDGVSFSWFDEAPAGQTTYSALGLDATAPYWFLVTGIGGSIESSASNVTSATTLVVAAPTGVSATFQSGTDANLTWTDNSSDETGFEIDWSNGNGTWQPLDTVAANTTEYDATNLVPGARYTSRVLTLADAGVSAPSDTPLQTAPRAPWLSAVQVGAIQVKLTWNKFAGMYTLQRSNGSGWTTIQTVTDSNTTTYTDGPPATSTTYQYRIGAVADGQTTYCDPVSVDLLPTTPTSLQAKLTTDANPQMKLTWTNYPSTETGYVVERSTDGINFTQLTITGTTATTYTDTTWTPGPDYTYRISAENAAGLSGYAYATAAPSGTDITFDNLSVGTVINSQYPPATFSADVGEQVKVEPGGYGTTGTEIGVEPPDPSTYWWTKNFTLISPLR